MQGRDFRCSMNSGAVCAIRLNPPKTLSCRQNPLFPDTVKEDGECPHQPLIEGRDLLLERKNSPFHGVAFDRRSRGGDKQLKRERAKKTNQPQKMSSFRGKLYEFSIRKPNTNRNRGCCRKAKQQRLVYLEDSAERIRQERFYCCLDELNDSVDKGQTETMENSPFSWLIPADGSQGKYDNRQCGVYWSGLRPMNQWKANARRLSFSCVLPCNYLIVI